ncbi:HWE histidine kinase domain-containing protein [Rhodobacter sp. 24-YEA-8]|uniref:HWE histidine kinase domain-containing protein n=1 Tax=Rhodobacter sp. 24-YEA-8 TaxID=1884310 RepID=UPI001495F455|nr:HWE histidine kinase domain-containing protein [Rhodobacter sp. 24-YEA-8]
MITIYNDAFVPILGQKTPCLGQSFSQIWAEAWHEIGPIARKALQGDSTFIRNFELQIERGNGPEYGWFTFCYSPIIDENGSIAGFLNTVIETTGEVITARRSSILNGELQHRIKNAYAKAIAIVRLTFRQANSAEVAQEAVVRRLCQLDQAQRALLADIDGTLDIRTLIADALAGSLPENRLIMRGRPVMIEADQVFALSLALGELATNAQKYGAWSNDDGRVQIEWTQRRGQFELTWREEGGPPVTEPETSGFGRELIEEALRHEFRGEAVLKFEPDGVVFTLRSSGLAPPPDQISGFPPVTATVAPEI